MSTVASYLSFQQADRAVKFALAAIDAEVSPHEALSNLYTAVSRCGVCFTCPTCGVPADDDDLALAAAHDIAASAHELRAVITADGLARARERVERLGMFLHRSHRDLAEWWTEELDVFASLDGVPDTPPDDLADW